MNAQNRFAELWTDYLEGELDETGIAELRELLAADQSLLKLAADMYQTHRLFIREVLSRLPEEQDSFVSGVMADVEQMASSGKVTRRASEDRPDLLDGAAERRRCDRR